MDLDGYVVPQEHQNAAHEICQHLVTLRGGAPFLSSTDAQLLLKWLDDAVPVTQVLCALERAAERRRARQSRLPLTLTAAKRHLGKRAKPFRVPNMDSNSQFLPVISLLASEDDPQAVDLAARLAHIECADPENAIRQATGATRAFFEAAWSVLDPSERQTLFDIATSDYADCSPMEPAALDTAIEERAHALHRARYPYLTVATFWQLVDPT